MMPSRALSMRPLPGTQNRNVLLQERRPGCRRVETTMNRRTTHALIAALSLAALAAAGAWIHTRSALSHLRAQVLASELQPMMALLREDQAILKELQTDPFAEPNAGVLESYLAKIRRDGVPKHVDMKQRLDQLAENNSAIVTLIKVYSRHSRTIEFVNQGDQFRNYAAAWRDRWNSVMELFMAGGNYAASEVPFPERFPAGVDAEIAAAN
jgi:hypothetical protein